MLASYDTDDFFEGAFIQPVVVMLEFAGDTVSLSDGAVNFDPKVLEFGLDSYQIVDQGSVITGSIDGYAVTALSVNFAGQ